MDEILNDLVKFRDFATYKNPSVTFFGSARFDENSKYCKMAFSLAKELADGGFVLLK